MQQHFTDHQMTIEGQCNNISHNSSHYTFKVAGNLELNFENNQKFDGSRKGRGPKSSHVTKLVFFTQWILVHIKFAEK